MQITPRNKDTRRQRAQQEVVQKMGMWNQKQPIWDTVLLQVGESTLCEWESQFSDPPRKSDTGTHAHRKPARRKVTAQSSLLRTPQSQGGRGGRPRAGDCTRAGGSFFVRMERSRVMAGSGVSDQGCVPSSKGLLHAGVGVKLSVLL